MKTTLLLTTLALCASSSFCQLTNILLDYDAVDEIAASDSGGFYERDFWQVNSNFPDADSVRGLSWTVVRFDTLYDADSFVAYSYNDKASMIDSIRVSFMHENISGTQDTVVVSVYEYQGSSGIEVDSLQQITNLVLYDSMIITTTSLTDPFQVGAITIYPALQLALGERFLAGVHFYGDMSNTFNLLTGYTDLCGAACFDPSASPSVFESNSFYRIIYWDGPISFSGVNSLVFDCDGDTNPGEPEECELSPIQNINISSFVSFISDTSDTTTSAGMLDVPLFKLYPNPADNFVLVELNESNNSEVQLSLIDTKGRRLRNKSYSYWSRGRLKLDVSNLPTGLYFLTLTDSLINMTVKLIKN